MEQAIIRTTDLTRRFGRRSAPIVAVNRLALHVPRGSVYGFLGPNGAGKTTTIRMLLGLMRPDEGEAFLFDQPLRRKRLSILRRVGALVETPSLYPHLTGWENLEVIRRMIGGTATQVGRALNIVRLEKDSGRLVREYSLGMRQRLGLAMTFLTDPELLILDEPTNGLDPAGIREIRELLGELPKREGVTVFLSSHLLGEVEQIATHIGIINQGRLIFQGTPEELRARQRDQLTLIADRLPEAQQFLQQSGWQVSHNGNNHLNIEVNGRSDVALINGQLVRAGLNVYELRLTQPSLEDIFLTLTKEEALS
jgi:ABC-2 type transport system ATP-binding protein